MRPIEWIVVHTSATADKQGNPVDASAEQMRVYHQQHNGWNDIGYHFVIRMSGLIEQGRALTEVGAHVGGFNEKSVGICVSGHGDVSDFTSKQHEVLAAVCAQLVMQLGLDPGRVIGHREADDHGAPHVDKTCPGTKVDMDRVRANVEALLPRKGPPSDAAIVLLALERRVAALEAKFLTA